MNNTAIIILAAGSSSRFGSTKQLLHFNKKTLLQHVIDEAIGSGAEPVIVITGANADTIVKDIDKKQTRIVFNKKWKEGMASGIAAGVHAAITYNNNIEKIIFTGCDQPFISSSLLKQFYALTEKSVKQFVESAYA